MQLMCFHLSGATSQFGHLTQMMFCCGRRRNSHVFGEKFTVHCSLFQMIVCDATCFVQARPITSVHCPCSRFTVPIRWIAMAVRTLSSTAVGSCSWMSSVRRKQPSTCSSTCSSWSDGKSGCISGATTASLPRTWWKDFCPTPTSTRANGAGKLLCLWPAKLCESWLQSPAWGLKALILW